MQAGQAEEGKEGSVGTELDAEFVGAEARAARSDGAIQVLHSFTCELHSGDGTHGVGFVVCETPFVGVSEGACLEERSVRKNGGGGNGRVVYGSNIDEVVYWFCQSKLAGAAEGVLYQYRRS